MYVYGCKFVSVSAERLELKQAEVLVFPLGNVAVYIHFVNFCLVDKPSIIILLFKLLCNLLELIVPPIGSMYE
jgi:hypothetical protein